MPGFDQTGPVGAGPMTGRAMGSCRSEGVIHNPGNQSYGRGMGKGHGRGFRRMHYRFFSRKPPYPMENTPDIAEEIRQLKARLAWLESMSGSEEKAPGPKEGEQS